MWSASGRAGAGDRTGYNRKDAAACPTNRPKTLRPPGGRKLLTRLVVKNFKRFRHVEIELGNPVVFIGPNDSGKTTALQALALWDLGLRRWLEKRGGGKPPEKRPGVTINRRDLLSVPVPSAILLWHRRDVRNALRQKGEHRTENIRIEIRVEGVSDGTAWTCGLEFDYANEESFYCRPLLLPDGGRMAIPEPAAHVRVAFLPPLSGLTATEARLDPGRIDVLLGEGRTAEVLRNLCYLVRQDPDGERRWSRLCRHMQRLFGVTLEEPKYIPERGEITMWYKDRSGTKLDLGSSGRGMQQTLLLLAYLEVHPGSVLLLDEPDAHLEILRQREIYHILGEAARESGNQVIIASHSEVVLNEAADRDVVVAFVGRPHRIDDRSSQVLKSLKDIGFDQYYLAEQTGWVLYLEGATDLAILRAFAAKLGHRAERLLERVFSVYVENQPSKVYDHFYGLLEAKPDLVGYALFDRLPRPLPEETKPNLVQYVWTKREIENYLCQRETLLAWAEKEHGPLFRPHMEEAIAEVEQALATLGKGSPWSADLKVSDEFLDPLFAAFYRRLGLPNLMRKADFHKLVPYVPDRLLDAEITAVLDGICATGEKAKPQGSEPD